MGYLTDSVRALALTIKSVFRPPTTVHYPAQRRERAVRYRNSFALLHDEQGDELCVGCVQCEKICPSQVITVIAEKKDSPVSGKRRGYAKDFVLDLNACIFCELCVQVCPTDAIIMTRESETPAYNARSAGLDDGAPVRKRNRQTTGMGHRDQADGHAGSQAWCGAEKRSSQAGSREARGVRRLRG